jgi:predicted ATPase
MAKFSRLVLKNWRNFRHVDVPVSLRTFVVGPNASGKTNLLDAIRFLHDIAAPEGSLTSALKERGGLSRIRSLHTSADENVLIEVQVIVDDEEPWTYTLELTGTDANERIAREVVFHGDRQLLRRPLPEDANEGLLTQTHLEQISQTIEFRLLAKALATVETVHVVPQIARTLARGEEQSKRQAPGSDFIDQIALLPELQRKKVLGRIETLLRIAVPRFGQLSFERDDRGRPHLRAKYDHWREAHVWQNEQELSDGTLRLIGLLWAVEAGNGPILLDEPDLSLHPGIIRQLPRLFARLAERQVIVSTNAEEILMDRGIDPGEIIIVEPVKDESRVVVGSERTELVEAVRARAPLSRIVTSITQPADIELFSLSVGSNAQ